MAGIGFELKRLYSQGSTMSGVSSALHGVMASSGPWILSMLLLLGIQLMVAPHMQGEDHRRLLAILIYSFAFSLVWPAGLINMSIRSLADLLYRNQISEVSNLMFSILILVGVGAYCLSGLFFYHLAPGTGSFEGQVLFTCMSMLWVMMSFSSTLSRYGFASLSYALGLIVSFILLVSQQPLTLPETLRHVSLAFAIPLCFMYGQMMLEFGKPLRLNFGFLKTLSYYPLLVSGLAIQLGTWADKILYWYFSPYGSEVSPGFFLFLEYDAAVFMANLLLFPAFTYFLMFVETEFATAQRRFLTCIETGGGYSEIVNFATLLRSEFIQSLVRLTAFQALTSLAALVLFPAILTQISNGVLIAPLLKICLLNVLLQLIIQALIIFLYYLDLQKEVVLISVCLLLLNVTLTVAFLEFPWKYTGYSYFLALLLTTVLAMKISHSRLQNLVPHTFLKNQIL